MGQGRTFIISGVSGSGKSTISDRLISEHDNLRRATALTTRFPREGERFGVHYFFVSLEIFQWLNETSQLLEYTQVYGDTFYGTLRFAVESLLDHNHDVLFVCDNRGVNQILEYFPKSKIAYLAAPSEEEQRTRLIRRGTFGEDLEIRVSKAREEMEQAKENGWPIIVNDELGVAMGEVTKLFFGKA